MEMGEALTKEQMDELREAFLLFDKNRDGGSSSSFIFCNIMIEFCLNSSVYVFLCWELNEQVASLLMNLEQRSKNWVKIPRRKS